MADADVLVQLRSIAGERLVMGEVAIQIVEGDAEAGEPGKFLDVEMFHCLPEWRRVGPVRWQIPLGVDTSFEDRQRVLEGLMTEFRMAILSGRDDSYLADMCLRSTAWKRASSDDAASIQPGC
jgi:hypothetical protein